jgi:uncharacterized protein YfeS
MLEEDTDHDPWNDPHLRHPRAQELMPEPLWDCVDELAPFGSDEGWEAYYEFREWRAANPEETLLPYLESIAEQADDFPDDDFTLDATLIATVLGQLVDEGRIDAAAKPFAFDALERQSQSPAIESCGEHAPERLELLRQIREAIDAG